jgi:hypothetical protein
LRINGRFQIAQLAHNLALLLVTLSLQTSKALQAGCGISLPTIVKGGEIRLGHSRRIMLVGHKLLIAADGDQAHHIIGKGLSKTAAQHATQREPQQAASLGQQPAPSRPEGRQWNNPL